MFKVRGLNKHFKSYEKAACAFFCFSLFEHSGFQLFGFWFLVFLFLPLVWFFPRFQLIWTSVAGIMCGLKKWCFKARNTEEKTGGTCWLPHNRLTLGRWSIYFWVWWGKYMLGKSVTSRRAEMAVDVVPWCGVIIIDQQYASSEFLNNMAFWCSNKFAQATEYTNDHAEHRQNCTFFVKLFLLFPSGLKSRAPVENSG